MVVMEGVCAAAASGEAVAGSPTGGSHHRAWYDPATNQSDQLDAYFKGSNASTAAYFSQMQGAYPSMSYHGARNTKSCQSSWINVIMILFQPNPK